MDIVFGQHYEYSVVESPLGVVNGDAAFIHQNGNEVFFTLVDGSGHGQEAHDISKKSCRIIQENLNKSLTEIRGTRGCVAIIGKLDVEKKVFNYVGIGNIFLKKVTKSVNNLLIQDGVVGYHIRTPSEYSVQLEPGDALLLCSDGIKSNFNISDYPDIRWDDVDVISKKIINMFTKNNDDATCIVLRCKHKNKI